jgi:hypothetical protein
MLHLAGKDCDPCSGDRPCCVQIIPSTKHSAVICSALIPLTDNPIRVGDKQQLILACIRATSSSNSLRRACLVDRQEGAETVPACCNSLAAGGSSSSWY